MNKYVKIILLSILIIFPIVTIHELGHLIAGILLNLNPESFSFGFGPKILEYNYWNINWEIRVLPLGGFVSFPPEMGKMISHDFLIALLAGPLTNFIMGIGLYYYLFKEILNKAIFFSNGEDFLLDLSFFNLGKHLYVLKDSEIFELEEDTEVTDLEEYQGYSWFIIKVKSPFKFVLVTLFSSYFKRYDKILNELVIESIKSEYEHPYALMSPIGIIKNGIWEWDKHKLSFISFMASLSIGVGMLNLFPIPIFDGGKFLIILGELYNLSFIEIILILLIIINIFRIVKNRILIKYK